MLKSQNLPGTGSVFIQDSNLNHHLWDTMLCAVVSPAELLRTDGSRYAHSIWYCCWDNDMIVDLR